MNRNVTVSVTGTQDCGGGWETAAGFEGRGQYFEKNGWRYLLYREQDTDSGALTSNTLKIGDHLLELSRKGNVNTRIIFEAGRTHPAGYVTGFCSLPLEVCTEDVKCLWTETKASIIITYKLMSAGTFLSRNRLSIKISQNN